MIKIPAGKILAITGSSLSSGTAYWVAPGAQSVFAGSISSTVAKFGPYMHDAELDIVMDAGTYTEAFVGDNQVVPSSSGVITAMCNTLFSATSTTTLANVVGAVTPVLQVGDYMIEGYLFGTGGAGGIKAGFKQSVAGMLNTLNVQYTTMNSTPTFFSTSWSDTSDDSAFMTLATNPRVITFTGIATLRLPGTLQLRAAQDTSNATASTIRAGSYFRMTAIN